jgi:hypothetical protein
MGEYLTHFQIQSGNDSNWDDDSFFQAYGSRPGQHLDPAATVVMVNTAGHYRFQVHVELNRSGSVNSTPALVIVAEQDASGSKVSYAWSYLTILSSNATLDAEWVGFLDVGGCVGFRTQFSSSGAGGFTQQWSTNNIPKPTGVWYNPSDSGNLRVVSAANKEIYTLNLSTKQVTAKTGPLSVTYPGGLSGDPSDASVYWVLDSPWAAGSGANSRILKMNASTNAVISTFTLNTNHWSDMKVDSSVIWLANLTTGQFHTRSKSDGSAIAAYGPTYSGAVSGSYPYPTGIAINGTTGYLFFEYGGRVFVVNTSSPTVVLSTLSTTGTTLLGGEINVSTGDLYGVNFSQNETYDYKISSGSPDIMMYGEMSYELISPLVAL